MEKQLITIRVAKEGRLVYYRKAPDPKYWTELWDRTVNADFYENALAGRLGYLEPIYREFLPSDGPILEAGCGAGQVVLGLRKLGYPVEGVDFAEDTISRVRDKFPDLPVSVGDVCNLQVADGYYTAYISLGVIEHREEGPEPFLEEAFRVIKPSGIAIFTVPWFNPTRRLKSWLGFFRSKNPSDLEFYQYAYRAKEIKSYLTAAGFEVLKIGAYGNIQMGFEDEIPLVEKTYKFGRLGRFVKRIFRGSSFIKSIGGHTMAYICKRP